MMGLGGMWRADPWAGGMMGAYLFNKSKVWTSFHLTLSGAGYVCGSGEAGVDNRSCPPIQKGV